MEELLVMSRKELNPAGIIQQVIDGKLSQALAALELAMTNRQIRRLVVRFKEKGVGGLVHGLRGQASNHQFPVEVRNKAISLVGQHYADFGPTLAAEKLAARHDLVIDHDTLRRTMVKAGLWQTKKRKATHRQWRERKTCSGQMVQFDGSDHDWLEARGERLVLLASRDDATNHVVAHFARTESCQTVFAFWHEYVQSYGKPRSIYLDRHSIYTTSRPIQGQGEPFEATQFERAMAELGVTVINANSPQAKGRIENLFGTLQDRLVKELRLEKINALDEANVFLKETFLPYFNQKFQVEAKETANLHQSLKAEEQNRLASIFSFKQTRTVTNDFTLRFKNKWLQLEPVQPTLILPGQKVTIEERLDQSIELNCRGTYLSFQVCAKPPMRLLQIPALTSNPNVRIQRKPSADHPWRKGFLAHSHN